MAVHDGQHATIFAGIGTPLIGTRDERVERNGLQS